MNDKLFGMYLHQILKPLKIFGLTQMTDSKRALILKDHLPGALFGVYTLFILVLKLLFHPITNKFDIILLVDACMTSIRNLSIILSFFAISYQLGDLTNGIEIFDSKMPRLRATQKSSRRLKKRQLWYLFYLAAFVFVFFLVKENYLHDVHVNQFNFGRIRFIYLLICLSDYPTTFYWLICPIPFLVLCQEFKKRFEDLQSILKERLAAIIGRNRLMGNCEQSIENVRLLHAELTSLAELFGSSFGLYLTSYFLFTFLKQLILFYKCLHVTEETKLIRILMFIQTWVGAFLHSTFSEKLMTSSRKIVEQLRTCPTTKLPTVHCQEQILLFTIQLQTAGLSITASELFTVDKQLLTSMIMAVTTYIIVIIQLTPDIHAVLSRLNLNETTY